MEMPYAHEMGRGSDPELDAALMAANSEATISRNADHPTKKLTRLRSKGRRGGESETFAKLPDELLTSDAYRTLPLPATRLLGALTAQFRGPNNGSLIVTFAQASDYGVTSKRDYADSLVELKGRGLIKCTRQGAGGHVRMANMFAVTWAPIGPPQKRDPHEAAPTVKATNEWARWVFPDGQKSPWVIAGRKPSDFPSKEKKPHEAEIACGDKAEIAAKHSDSRWGGDPVTPWVLEEANEGLMVSPSKRDFRHSPWVPLQDLGAGGGTLLPFLGAKRLPPVAH